VRQYYEALLQFLALPRAAGVTVVSLAISGRLTRRWKTFRYRKLKGTRDVLAFQFIGP
jgi:hypothetical protein